MAWPQPGGARTFLVVDDDERVRAMVRFTLELEGLAVVEAPSLVQARHLLGPDISGIVLDRQLPDGDGLDLLPDIGRLSPDAPVVVCSALLDGREPPGLSRVDKSDMEGLVAAFGLGAEDDGIEALTGHAGQFAETGRFGQVVRAMSDQLLEDWVELCKWDPELAVDATPAAGAEFVAALADALDRPQPLGWGIDPAIEEASGALALGVATPAAAIA